MKQYMVEDTSLIAVADAIRSKAELSGALKFPEGFVSAIQDITTNSELQYATGTSSSTTNLSTLGSGISGIQIRGLSFMPKFVIAAMKTSNGSESIFGLSMFDTNGNVLISTYYDMMQMNKGPIALFVERQNGGGKAYGNGADVALATSAWNNATYPWIAFG